MFKKLAQTWLLVATYLGVEKVPIMEGKIAFDDDQKSKLNEKFGEEFTSQLLEAFDKEIAANTDADELLKAKQEVLAVLQESGYSEEEQAEILGSDNLEEADTAKMSSQYKQMAQNYLDLKAKYNEQEKQIQKLLRDPEPETALNIIKNTIKAGDMKHSVTHLFATGKVWDEFDNRPWNARFRDGGMKATDFNTGSSIPLLQDDLEHFVRENPTALNSLFDDFEDLPKDWARRTGVLDRVADGYIIPAEIVQGRAPGWSPKNNFHFDTEEGKVWRKKIDISFDGFQLQEIETTWIAAVKSMDGSHPWKMSFIGFLLSELVKQQKLDDRIAQINGIFAQSPGGDNNPGAAINSQSGLRWLWWYYRDVTQQITPFNMGTPSAAGIVDYVRDMIEKIPVEQRNQSGWEIQLSEQMYRMYAEKAGEKYDLKFNTDLGKEYYPLNYPIDYPNFKFQVLKDMTKTDFIGIVKSKNVQILDYMANEKSKFTITHTKRNTDIFADYRLGIRFIAVGTKTLPNDPKEFEKQLMFCNNVPVFSSATSAPAFDDTTGILKMNYTGITVDAAWNTDIANIVGAKDGPYKVDLKGKVITITGNPNLVGTPAVKDNANLDLTADFGLKTSGTLTLIGLANGTFKELSRTASAPAVEGTDVEFTTAVIDAALGTQFNFEGGSNTTMTDILNGVHGQQITITKTNGGSTSCTVPAITDKVVLGSSAVLDTTGDTITLVNVNGVWYEVSRTIAP